MRPVVIGLVGPISSGKGFLGVYLASRGFFYISTSDRVREEVDRRGLSRARESLQDVGNQLRASLGSAILVERCLSLIPEGTDMVVIDGIRNPGEALFVKEELGGVIVGVDAPVKLRLKWYLDRAMSRGEDGVTEADFWRANKRDLGDGEDSLGQQGAATLAMSDWLVVNDGTERMTRECQAWLLEKFGIRLEGKRQRVEG